MNSRTLLQIAERALNEIPNRRGIPGLDGEDIPHPFNGMFSSYDLAAEIGRHLRENKGFTVILGYPDSHETYSGTSGAGTWQEAVCEVAAEMLKDGAVSREDELTITDVMEGLEHSTSPNTDRYAVVRFNAETGDARVLDTEEVRKEDAFDEALLYADSHRDENPGLTVEEAARWAAQHVKLLSSYADEFVAMAVPRLQKLADEDVATRKAGKPTAHDNIRRIVMGESTSNPDRFKKGERVEP
jgi:hypothetical protein